ncbi:MAG TPA: flagellar FliJ family protein [Gaiellaceae bacterium]|jgi:flagellar export protein FliJ|nr:flagellar FliJ family protein [Gaiellaceae bacterium]
MTKRRFQFKLEPVRTLRENAELNAMKELAGELERAARLRQELDAVAGRLADARLPLADVTTGTDLAFQQAYLERVERELDEARRRTAIQDGHVEHSRIRLAAAVRARQTLDRLEERRRSAHELEQRRLERAAADEISLTSHRTSMDRSSEHAA